MTGFIKITVSEVDKEFLEEYREAHEADRTSGADVVTNVSLHHVSVYDKFILLRALMRAIELSEDDLKMYIAARRLGIRENEVVE